MISRTKNWFYTSSRFLSGAFWRDVNAGWLAWPSLWVEPNRQPSFDVTLTRVSFGWLQWRAQCDIGHWHPIDTHGPLDWEALGTSEYLAWSRRTFGKSWGRADIEKVFRAEPALRRLCMMGTFRNHYIRVAVARTMLLAQEAPVSAQEPLGEAFRGGEGSTSQRAWTDIEETQTQTPESLLEDLEGLDRTLQRRDEDIEK